MGLDLDMLNALPSIKITNTDTTTDIDGLAEANFSELFGTVEWNDDVLIYSPSLTTASVILLQAGRYCVSAYFAMLAGVASNSARNNIAFRLYLNGVQISPNFQNNYVRDASGNNETGQDINSFCFEANANDVIQLRRQRVAGAGGVQTLEGTNNYIQITKVSMD